MWLTSNGAITDVVMGKQQGLLPKFAPKVGGVILPEDVKNHVHSWEEHLAMLHAGVEQVCHLWDCPEWTEDQISLKHPLIQIKGFRNGMEAYTLYLPHRKEIINVIRMHHHNAVAQDLY